MIRKCFLNNAMLMASVAIVVLCTSCREDESLVFEIGNDLVSNGLDIDIDGGFYNIPIKSDFAWTASLPEDCDWAGLSRRRGDGTATLCICFDPNYTEPERSTILSISNGESVHEIVLKQRTNDQNSDYYNLANSKGLGWGYDPVTMKIKRSGAVLCLDAMDLLKSTNSNMFVSNKLSILDALECSVDSVEKKKDTLGVRLHVDISYMNFSLGLSGAYVSGEKRNTKMKRYKTAVAYPTLEARVSYADAIAHYYDWCEEKNPQENDFRGHLLTNGFAKRVQNLITACNAQTPNDTDVRKKAKEIIDKYGPAVVVNTQMGGSLSLLLYVDSTYTEEKWGIDTAVVSAKISNTIGGFFSLDANVAASYRNSATEIFTNSNCTCLINGGKRDDMANIYACFQEKRFDELNSEIGNWIANISTYTTDNDSTNLAELISVDIVPIWCFVEDTKARSVLRSYALESYRGVTLMEQMAKVFL